MNCVEIVGARTHHLKNVSLAIPHGQLVVFTGKSGSGKSSLVFDTIHAESQRQFAESFSLASRQHLRHLPKPAVSSIDGLPPTIAIAQRLGMVSRYGTVGTLSEIHDYLKVLFARCGTVFCYRCAKPIRCQSPQQMIDRIHSLPEGIRFLLLAPIRANTDETEMDVVRRIAKAGFLRVRIGKTVFSIDEINDVELSKIAENSKMTKMADIQAVIDRMVRRDGMDTRLTESLELALKQGDGTAVLSWEHNGNWQDETLSLKYWCPDCEIHYRQLEPRHFSFTSPFGACPTCQGNGELAPSVSAGFNRPDPALTLGAKHQFTDVSQDIPCPDCGGSRLCEESRNVRFAGHNIHDLCSLTIRQAREFFQNFVHNTAVWETVPSHLHEVVDTICAPIRNRLEFLDEMGLDYLTLARRATSLSLGELRRVRLAGSLGGSLQGVLYVLDEPTIGLHPRDTHKLIAAMKQLRDTGNSVFVVEHDESVIAAADRVVHLGPGAGKHGGEIMGNAPSCDLAPSVSAGFDRDNPALTLGAPIPNAPSTAAKYNLSFKNITLHNLNNVSVDIPLEKFVCVSGVSGSGKTSLVFGAIVPLLKSNPTTNMVEVDSSPIGKNSRSCPATFSGIADEIRKLFATTKEARRRGFGANRFSFNMAGGRCDTCKGLGVTHLEMEWMPDFTAPCPDCGGRRFNEETLTVRYRHHTIADVFDMEISDAATFFAPFPKIAVPLTVLHEIGLGYLSLGQSATTLSGGESQRLKLAVELTKPLTGHTLYILDEPTSGLHSSDIAVLLTLLRKLVAAGNTVLVIEHQLDVLRQADWIIDMGPDSGERGGNIVAVGPPATIAATPESITGRYI